MVKGGFQGLDISGVDLTAQSPTLPGAYAACAGAEGKTVLVLTAAGAVQCSVKKVSTNYVLAGITGDGKILSITIGNTDGISVSEAAIPSAEEPENYLDAAIDISNATSLSPYTTEYDGLIRIEYDLTAQTTLGVECSVTVKGGPTHSTGVRLLRLLEGSPAGASNVVFVKKGTMVYCPQAVEKVTAKFFPYKPVVS